MSTTERLGLALLTPGQAQKEFFHNESMEALDVLVGGCVDAVAQDDPPGAPVLGASYIVGAAPTGDWASHAGGVAAWTSGGWRFLAPVDGMTLQVRGNGANACFREGAWEIGVLRGSSVSIHGTKVLGAQQAAIASPSGGTTIDNEARAAIGAMLSALRSHGLIEA
jgi:hypothetical protein